MNSMFESTTRPNGMGEAPSFMLPAILIGLSVIVTLILTIILAVAVVPDKKRDKLKGFAVTLNDIFNFRGLLIESIIRFLYLLSTVACVVTGFFALFLVVRQSAGLDYYGGSEYVTRWYGWIGIIIMVLGPIIIRLAFEGMMLFILLVKNTIQINNKLKGSDNEVKASPVPVAQNPYSTPKCETVKVPEAKPVPEVKPVTETAPAPEAKTE